MAVDLKKMKKTHNPESKHSYKDIVGYEGERTPDVGCLAYTAIEHVTKAAALIVRKGSGKLWVPMSQIVDSDAENITVTKWWLDKNDIDGDW